MITFYHNKGKTIDSYSMDVRVTTARDGIQYDCYSFSKNPQSPQGVNSFLGTIKNPNHEDEWQIDFDDLPLPVQLAVTERLLPDHKIVLL